MNGLFIETAVLFPVIFGQQKLLLVFWRLRNFIRAFFCFFIKYIIYLSLVRVLIVIIGRSRFRVGVHLVSEFVDGVAKENVLVSSLVKQSFFLVWIVIACVFRIFAGLIHRFVIFRERIRLGEVFLDLTSISVTADFMNILGLYFVERNFILFECLILIFIFIKLILVFDGIWID